MTNLTGASQLDSGGIPTGSLKVPGVTLLKAIQGGAVFTDGLGDDSAPMRSELTNGTKRTYVGAGTVVPVTGATDLITIIGSATTLVKLIRVVFSATILTTAINGSISMVKRSAADTGGTSTAPTLVPLDSGNAGATAVMAAYTANPAALGTVVGSIWTSKYLYQPAATGNPAPVLVIDFNQMGQAGTLRGVAQQIALNLNAVTLASAGSVDYAFYFTEE
jgi:hypothetical protein